MGTSTPTPRRLRLLLSDRDRVSVDLATVQEIIHLRDGLQAASWDGPGSEFARIRSRTMPILDLNRMLGLTSEAAPTRILVVEIDRRLHALPAVHTEPAPPGETVLDLGLLLRKSA